MQVDFAMPCLVGLHETTQMVSQHLAWHDARHVCLSKLDEVFELLTPELRTWEEFLQPQDLKSVESDHRL